MRYNLRWEWVCDGYNGFVRYNHRWGVVRIGFLARMRYNRRERPTIRSMFLALVFVLMLGAALLLAAGVRLMRARTRIPVYPLGLALAVVGGVGTLAFLVIFVAYAIG